MNMDNNETTDCSHEEKREKLHIETIYEGLNIEVEGDSSCVRVSYKNDSSNGYSLGWVDGPIVTCETTEGEYYTSSESVIIKPGQTYEENYYFDDAEGELLSICISNINSLNSRGLPVDFSGGGSAKIDFQKDE